MTTRTGISMQQPRRQRSAFGCVVLSLCLVFAGGASAAVGVTVDPPVRIAVKTLDDERVMGWIISRDAEGFEVRSPRGDEIALVPWDDLAPDRVLWVQDKLLADDDARGWFELAAQIYPRDGGRISGEKALGRALGADPTLEDLAQRLRDGEAVTWADAAPEPETDDAPGPDTVDENAPDDAGLEPDDGEGDDHAAPHDEDAAHGPQVVGDIQTQFWGELSPELMAESVEALKKEADEATEQMGVRLRTYEDDNFLLFTDLPPAEARRWAGLLDEMYDRLLETFDLPAGQNIFRGKCAIYVFSRQTDYFQYCAQTLGFPAMGTAGVCHSRGDGFCVVAFYRQENTLNFAHVLVHESVHAFVHRYRSHPFIPSWINEGLAEHIAYKLVDSRGFGESDWAQQAEYMRRRLRQLDSLQGMLDLPHIQGWQYPVASELCAFMIRQSPTRYRDFINAIKDGKHWQQALREDYGIDRDQLVRAFGDAIGARNLRP